MARQMVVGRKSPALVIQVGGPSGSPAAVSGGEPDGDEGAAAPAGGTPTGFMTTNKGFWGA